jgi:hypothetical protein
MQTAEQAYLAERKQARVAQESIIDQPVNTEAVDVSEDAPVEEVVESEVITNEEVAPETDEPAEAEIEQATNENESEDLYVEYQGREINLKDVYETEQGQLRQADYTRKTQEHAEDIKTFKAKEDDFNVKQSELNDKLAQLNAMIEEDTPSAEMLAEWREYEPEKYIEHTEKMVNRKKFVTENKQTEKAASFDVEAERKALWDANPTWLQDGKQTEAFKTDMASIQSYASSNGFNDFSKFKANDFQMMLKASKYDALNNKNAAIEKKVRKAPVITKPRAKANSSVQDEIKVVQARYNRTGNDKDFLLLRKLNRQLK